MFDGHLSPSRVLDHQVCVFRKEIEDRSLNRWDNTLVNGLPHEGGREALGHRGQVMGVVAVETRAARILGEAELRPVEILLKDELAFSSHQNAVDLMPFHPLQVVHQADQISFPQPDIRQGCGLPAITGLWGCLILEYLLVGGGGRGTARKGGSGEESKHQ